MCRLLARSLLLLAVATVGTPVLLGAHASQAPALKTVAFEVASVKPSAPDSRDSMMLRPTGITATNVRLETLITMAYRIDSFRLAGNLDHLSEHYDVSATLPDGTTLGQLDPMLQTLLAERFKLKAHMEQREQQVFALVMVRSDKRLGPDMRPSTLDCKPIMASRATHRTDVVPQIAANAPCYWSMFPGRIVMNDGSLDVFASNLSGLTNRIVLNRTGLAGAFSFTLRFATEGTTQEDAPSIFTALQEQLGLKLESTKAPVDVLVIDHVEKPTPD